MEAADVLHELSHVDNAIHLGLFQVNHSLLASPCDSRRGSPSMIPFKVISLILAVPVLGLLAARGGGGFKLSMPFSSEGPVPAEGTGLGDVGPVVRFDPFVVSEGEGDGQLVSTVTFELEVSDTSGRDAVKSRTSEIRSAILAVLADTKLGDVGDPEDFAALKKKVQDRVQSMLPDHLVRRVLITEFLSQ